MCSVTVLGVGEIICTFEQVDTCLLGEDLSLKERWNFDRGTIDKWDNTLNIR